MEETLQTITMEETLLSTIIIIIKKPLETITMEETLLSTIIIIIKKTGNNNINKITYIRIFCKLV